MAIITPTPSCPPRKSITAVWPRTILLSLILLDNLSGQSASGRACSCADCRVPGLPRCGPTDNRAGCSAPAGPLPDRGVTGNQSARSQSAQRREENSPSHRYFSHFKSRAPAHVARETFSTAPYVGDSFRGIQILSLLVRQRPTRRG